MSNDCFCHTVFKSHILHVRQNVAVCNWQRDDGNSMKILRHNLVPSQATHPDWSVRVFHNIELAFHPWSMVTCTIAVKQRRHDSYNQISTLLKTLFINPQ